MKIIFTIVFGIMVRTLIAQCPDLTITNAAILNLEPNSIRYGINMSNIGNKDTKLDWSNTTDLDNVIIKSYLSYDAIIDLSDIRIHDIVLGYSPLDNIKAEEIFSIVNRDSIGTSGYQYLILSIDTHNNINECSIQNNIYILPLRRNQLSLETTNLEGAKGTSVEIPVYASDFFNILGFQFSISFSKPSIIRIDSIGNLGLSELNKSDIRLKNDNSIGVIWFSALQNGLSFNDRRKLFSIFVTLTGEPGACSDIRFDDSFLPIEFISSSALSEPIRAQTINGQICVQNLVECSGRVTLSNNYPIVNAIVKANQSSAPTDFNGKYIIKDLIPGLNYTISASKTDAFANGLSVIDIVLIKKHLLQIQTLPSPYEIIAADVNGDLTISVQDMVLIRDLILGFIPNFGKTPVWQFIPKDYKFKNPQNPFLELYPISYFLPNLNSNKVALDFIGIKTGDVSLDWSERFSPPLESRSANFFTLTLNEEMLEANREYELPIYTRQFNNINGFQFALNLNPAIQFEKISSPTITDFNENNYSISGQNLKVLWYDSRVQAGRFVEDTGILFLVKFKTTKSINAKSLFTIDPTNLKPEGIHEQGWNYTIKMETLKLQNAVISDKKILEVKLFPNPVSNELQIQYNQEEFKGNTLIKIVDVNGRIVSEILHDKGAGVKNLSIPTSAWAEGKYTLLLSSEGQSVSRSFLCIH